MGPTWSYRAQNLEPGTLKDFSVRPLSVELWRFLLSIRISVPMLYISARMNLPTPLFQYFVVFPIFYLVFIFSFAVFLFCFFCFQFFPTTFCWGSPFLPSLSVSWPDCWNRVFPTPLVHQDVVVVVVVIVIVMLNQTNWFALWLIFLKPDFHYTTIFFF